MRWDKACGCGVKSCDSGDRLRRLERKFARFNTAFPHIAAPYSYPSTHYCWVMSQDVKQWIAEIRLLQQQIQIAQREREQAYASAENWRQLYQAEAQQRRTEAKLMQEKLDTLSTELYDLRQHLQQGAIALSPETDAAQHEDDAVTALADDELRPALRHALAECDRLRKQLLLEQTAHTETRQNLTTALADTMDLLKRETGDRPIKTPTPAASESSVARPKSPSPELPPLG